MKSTELWAIYVRRNPSFESSDTITMTKAGLRKLFDQTWQNGHDQGFRNGQAYSESQKPEPSVFESLFGSFKK